MNDGIFIESNKADGDYITLEGRNSMGYEVYLFLVGGVFIGYCLALILQRIKVVYGIFKVDRSNPDKDLYSIEIEDLDSLKGKTRVILTIKDITHKKHSL